MKKVFVGGNVMCGKNTLRKLLDNHPEMISNHIGHSIATSVLHRDVKKFISKGWSIGRISSNHDLPTIKINYNSGEEGVIDYPDLLWIMHRYGGYRFFSRCCRASKSYFKSKEGVVETVPFEFNIREFESELEHEFFESQGETKASDLIDIIYRLYAIHWNQNEKESCKSNNEKLFIDTLQNGIEPIQDILEEVPDSKILVMDRSTPSLVFANAIRMRQKTDWNWQYDKRFARLIYGHLDKAIEINSFRKQLKELTGEYDNVLAVDFEKMIQNTEETMRTVAKFLDIPFDFTLVNPSIGGKVLDQRRYPIIGKINDDPEEFVPKFDKRILRMMCYEPKNSWKIFYWATVRLILKTLRARIWISNN